MKQCCQRFLCSLFTWRQWIWIEVLVQIESCLRSILWWLQGSRHCQAEWSNERPRCAQSCFRKFSRYGQQQKNTPLIRTSEVLHNFDYEIVLEDELGVLDQDIVYQVSALRKFCFLLQLEILASSHWVVFMSICQGINNAMKEFSTMQ